MSLSKFDLALSLGVATSSLLAGGVIGYFISKAACPGKQAEDSEIVKKTYEEGGPDAAVDAYVIENSLREPSVLGELRQATKALGRGFVMISDPVEGQLIRLLMNITNAKKCIEVGTFTGYNALNMALTLPPDGKVVACDVSERFVSVGKPYFERAGVQNKIDVHIRPAVETLDALINSGESGTFDIVFVDADKSNYDTYYEKALLLLRQGGLILVDNTLWGGLVIGGDQRIMKMEDGTKKDDTFAIHHLNQKIKADKRVEISFLKIADGVTICRKL